MKVFISVDMEGISGVTHWDEVNMTKEESALFRKQMAAEAAAACEGALVAGADEILVEDAHDAGRNISAAELPPPARLLRGLGGSPFMILQELDSSFDAVVLIGYHARAGNSGSPLSHTMIGDYAAIKLNGRDVSEFTLASYTAAYHGVPVAFISGDQSICDEAAQFNPHIRTLAVKYGKGNLTVSMHPLEAVEGIRSGVARALERDLSQALIPLPERFQLEIRFRKHTQAYTAGFYPGAKMADDFTVQFEAVDFFDIWRFILFTTR